MKITWKGTLSGQVGFHAELQEYDAVPPVESLLLDHAPVTMNPEREAVAAYLAFGHWSSGDLQLPHRLGPNTAAAIERDMRHVAVRPSPIEYYPKPLELGIRDVHVGFDASYVRDDVAAIAVLPGSGWTGSVRTLHSIAVASNAFTLDVAGPSLRLPFCSQPTCLLTVSSSPKTSFPKARKLGYVNCFSLSAWGSHLYRSSLSMSVCCCMTAS